MKVAILNAIKKLTAKDYRLQHDSTGITLVHTPVIKKIGKKKFRLEANIELTEITEVKQ